MALQNTRTRCRTGWHSLTHSGGVSSQTRDGRELFLIANCIDLLRVGRLGRLGDALAARWLALEQAGLDQNWSAARPGISRYFRQTMPQRRDRR